MSVNPAVAYDLVKETTTTTGTGDYALGGAAGVAFQTFLAAGFHDGDYFPGVVTDNSGGFELGLYKFNTPANTVTRYSINWSSNGGSAVNWGSGTRVIYPALLSVFMNMAVQWHAKNRVSAPVVTNDRPNLAVDFLSLWHMATTGQVFMCTDPSAGAAVWRLLLMCAASNSVSDPSSNVLSGANNSTADLYQAVLAGQHNTCASGAIGATASGTYASAQHPNARVLGGGAAAGRQQAEDIVLAVQTTSAVATRLQLNNGSTSHLTLPTDGVFKVTARVTAWRTSDQKAASWVLTSLWYRSASGNPTQIGSTVGTTPDFYNTASSGTWTADFAADNTNKAIDINVTADSSTAVNWCARVEIEQVTN